MGTIKDVWMIDKKYQLLFYNDEQIEDLGSTLEDLSSTPESVPEEKKPKLTIPRVLRMKVVSGFNS